MKTSLISYLAIVVLALTAPLSHGAPFYTVVVTPGDSTNKIEIPKGQSVTILNFTQSSSTTPRAILRLDTALSSVNVCFARIVHPGDSGFIDGKQESIVIAGPGTLVIEPTPQGSNVNVLLTYRKPAK